MKSLSSPIPMLWNGQAFEPRGKFKAIADQQFVVGQFYPVEAREDRSTRQHRFYFARIKECWESLPDDLMDEYPSPEHLRKAALCRTGYAEQVNLVCADNTEALRAATLFKAKDSYCVIEVAGRVCRVWTAMSQSYQAMGKKVFHESSEAVLDWIMKQLERKAA